MVAVQWSIAHIVVQEGVEQLVDLPGFFVLHPMGRFFDEYKTAVVAAVDAGLGQFPPEKTVLGPPNEQGRHGDA